MLSPAPARIVRAQGSPGLVIAGMDVGIGSPGFCVVRRKEGGGFEHLYHKVVRTKSSDPAELRYESITDELSHVLRTYSPAKLIIEEQSAVQAGKRAAGKGFTADSSKTLVTVGIGHAAARIFRVPAYEVRAQSVRTAILGTRTRATEKGKTSSEKKKEMQRAMALILGIELPQDAADAGAMAIHGFQLRRFK